MTHSDHPISMEELFDLDEGAEPTKPCIPSAMRPPPMPSTHLDLDDGDVFKGLRYGAAFATLAWGLVFVLAMAVSQC